MAAEAEDQEPKKKLPIVKILIMTVGAILLVGAGAGGAVLFQKLTKPADDNPLAIVIERKAAPDAHAAADDHAAAPATDGHGAPAAGGHGAPAAAGAGQLGGAVRGARAQRGRGAGGAQLGGGRR